MMHLRIKDRASTPPPTQRKTISTTTYRADRNSCSYRVFIKVIDVISMDVDQKFTSNSEKC